MIWNISAQMIWKHYTFIIYYAELYTHIIHHVFNNAQTKKKKDILFKLIFVSFH